MIPDWFEKAACRGADTNLFFSKDPADQLEALAYCRSCPVLEQCGADADATDQAISYGIRAGLTANQRRLRREPTRAYTPRAELAKAKPLTRQLTAEGVSGCEISRRLGVNKRTVLTWCREFKAAA